jgi:pyruvate,water dikinase
MESRPVMPVFSSAFHPPLVLDLGGVHAAMLPLVGGKAANLGEMLGAGLPVPPGFCVTTEAYRQIAGSAAIDFEALDAAPPDQLARLTAQSRQSLLDVPIPAAIAQSVLDSYARLGDNVPVAVRSSATAEDLPYASFAGQQDTYLHIIGAAAVLEAVRRCWASLWTDRAVAYRSSNAIDHRAARLAVVVQRMVDSQVAGVLFTANPVTGRHHQAVIDASPGLGEAVVSGAVNPDHFVIDTRSGQILDRRLGDKRFEVRPLPGGGTQYLERASAAGQACITDDQVRALAALGQRVESHYRAPQDTEWAIDSVGSFWLTQARPITTLFPVPVGSRTPKTDSDDFRVYFCFSLAQGLHRPLTPMGLSAARLISTSVERLLSFPVETPADGAHVYAEGGQRIFFDLTGVLRSRVGRALMPRVLDFMEARSAVVLRQLTSDSRLSLNNRSPFGFLRRVAAILFKYRIPLFVLQGVADPRKAHARAKAIGATLGARLVLPPAATALERVGLVERILTEEVVPLFGPGLLPYAAAGMGLLALAGKLLGRDAQPEELRTVLRGLPDNVTTEMDLELWQLSRRIQQDQGASQLFLEHPVEELARRFQAGTLPPSAQNGLTEFLSRYGHRAVAEIDLGMPRWSDDPSHVLGVLANYLRLGRPELAPDAVFARGAAEAEAMIQTLIGRARRRGRLRARLVRFALDRSRRLSGMREMPKYYLIVAVATLRRELQQVGAELVRRKCIQSAGDIFFLYLTEVRAALVNGGDLRALVTERRQSYDAELRRRHVPRVILSDGTEPEAVSPAAAVPSDGALAGTPASSGVITGRARVIHDPVGAHLEPGEILVAPSTDPGWTPLFLTAGGLVMEMGGANSHGAVVAREYGIPAVVGVAGATQTITTGQQIRVDGTAGLVVTDVHGNA